MAQETLGTPFFHVLAHKVQRKEFTITPEQRAAWEANSAQLAEQKKQPLPTTQETHIITMASASTDTKIQDTDQHSDPSRRKRPTTISEQTVHTTGEVDRSLTYVCSVHSNNLPTHIVERYGMQNILRFLGSVTLQIYYQGPRYQAITCSPPQTSNIEIPHNTRIVGRPVEIFPLAPIEELLLKKEHSTKQLSLGLVYKTADGTEAPVASDGPTMTIRNGHNTYSIRRVEPNSPISNTDLSFASGPLYHVHQEAIGLACIEAMAEYIRICDPCSPDQLRRYIESRRV